MSRPLLSSCRGAWLVAATVLLLSAVPAASAAEGENGAPAAGHDFYTTPMDTELSVPAPGVLGNDADPDGDPLMAAPGELSTAANGTVLLAGDGSFLFRPASGFTGTDTFSYAVSDGSLGSGGVVSISVEPVNQPPVAAADAYTIAQDGVLTVPAPGVLGNDSDPDADSLQVYPAQGLTGEGGLVSLASDGSFGYTPKAGFAGTDSFTYLLSDGQASDEGTVTVTVTAPALNQPPVAAADDYATPAGVALDVEAPGLLGNDSDPDGDGLEARLVSGPGHAAAFALGDSGGFSYSPEEGFEGADTFTYVVTDGNGAESGPATVTLEILPRQETALTLTADPAYAEAGAMVTLTAEVVEVTESTLPEPTGTVEFFAGDELIGSDDLSSPAVLTVRDLPAGEHQVTAHYLGDAVNAPATSEPIRVTVAPRAQTEPPVSAPPAAVATAAGQGQLPSTGGGSAWPPGLGVLLLAGGTLLLAVAGRARRG